MKVMILGYNVKHFGCFSKTNAREGQPSGRTSLRSSRKIVREKKVCCEITNITYSGDNEENYHDGLLEECSSQIINKTPFKDLPCRD